MNQKIMALNLLSKAISDDANLQVENAKYIVSGRNITFKMVEEICYVWLQEIHDPNRGGKLGPVKELYCGGEPNKAAAHFVKYAGVDSSISVCMKFFRGR